MRFYTAIKIHKFILNLYFFNMLLNRIHFLSYNFLTLILILKIKNSQAFTNGKWTEIIIISCLCLIKN